MKRIVLAITVLAALLGLAAPAGAQGQSITIEPASVDAAGTAEVTVTGSGYTEGGFLSPCPGAGGTVEGLTDPATQCDLGAIQPYTPDADGAFTITMSVDVPAEGLVFSAGNLAGSESAVGVLTVGAAAPDAGAEAPPEEAPVDDGLAVTGVESVLLTILALAVVAGGTMVISTARRHNRI